MASKVDIANFALNIIGASTISSFTENVKAQQLLLIKDLIMFVMLYLGRILGIV